MYKLPPLPLSANGDLINICFLVSLSLGLFVSDILWSIMRISEESEGERGMTVLSLRLLPFLPQGTDIDLFLCELFLPTRDVL